MRLARNIVWNAAGIGLPLLIGIAVVPTIVKGLGTERFGFLSIVWMLIGYFSIFDLGLGRAVTKLAADKLARHQEDEIAPLASTALILVFVSGAIVGCLIAMSAGWIAERVVGNSPALLPEASTALVCLAISFPFVLLATILTGLLEAYQEFALINAVRVPLGILVLVAPLMVLPFSRNLAVITGVLAAIRILNAGVFALLTLRVVRGLRTKAFVFYRELVRPLLAFGGWLTVSNVVSPLMVYFDRLLIAAMLGSAAVAYYTVPYEMLTRLWVIPMAIQGVLFPTFATLHGQNSARIVAVFARSSEITLLLMMPAFLAVMLLAHEGLSLWLGPAFAANSSLVAQILMVGVLVNSLARAPFGFIQAAGHARWTAMLHLVELPAYALCLWIFVSRAGIVGAAYAWTGRTIVDTALLYVLAVRLERKLTWSALRDMVLLCFTCLAVASLGWFAKDLILRIVLVVIPATACGLVLLKSLGPVIWSMARKPRSDGTAG